MIEAIRKRPGMYVGGTDAAAIQQMVHEVLSNAIDLALARRCRRIHVDVTDDVITIADDGPGIPIVDADGAPFLDRVLTRQHVTATADGHAPHAHLALTGVGLFAINALSAELSVRVVRDGARHTIAYRRGIPDGPLTTTPSDEPTGTTVRFRPDPEIFRVTRPPRGALGARLDELAFLLPGASLTWSFGPDASYARGLAHLVAMRGSNLELPIVHAHGHHGNIGVEVALAWPISEHDTSTPCVESFVNIEASRRHGTHVDGLLDAVDALAPGLRTGLLAAVAIVLPSV